VQSFTLRKQRFVGGCGCRKASVNSTFSNDWGSSWPIPVNCNAIRFTKPYGFYVVVHSPSKILALSYTAHLYEMNTLDVVYLPCREEVGRKRKGGKKSSTRQKKRWRGKLNRIWWKPQTKNRTPPPQLNYSTPPTKLLTFVNRNR